VYFARNPNRLEQTSATPRRPYHKIAYDEQTIKAP